MYRAVDGLIRVGTRRQALLTHATPRVPVEASLIRIWTKQASRKRADDAGASIQSRAEVIIELPTSEA